MSLSLYDVSVPMFIRSLEKLSAILEKSRAFADEHGIAHAELLDARLFDDMAPLIAQIQRASDTARFTAGRVGRQDITPIADDEASFDDLQARITATITVLKAIPTTCMDEREDAEVILKTPKQDVSFTGKSYILNFAVPNFYFHVATAYNILRHKGIPLRKIDFLGGN